jgi:protease-4
MYSDYRLFTPGEKLKIQTMMEAVYHSFVKLVADSRDLKIEEVDKVARGRIWAGQTARELKLVDQIGGLLDAIEEAKKLAKIPPSEKVDIKIYPRKQSFLDFVFNVIDAKVHSPLKIDIEVRLQEYQHFFPALIVPYRIVIH